MNNLTNAAPRKSPSRLVLALAASVIGGVALALPAAAQSTSNPTCPDGYYRIDTVWYDAATGSVESTKTATGNLAARSPSIAKSNWSKQALCFENATGDVELFGKTVVEKTAAAGK